MTVAAQRLAALLTDFGLPGIAMTGQAEPRPAPSSSRMAAPVKPAQANIATLIADAVTQAETSLRATLEAEHRSQINALQDANRNALQALEAEAAQREAELVSIKLGFLEKHLIETISDATGQVLIQALAEPLRAQALNAFIAALKTLMAEQDAIRIEIAGPTHLTTLLKDRLSGQNWSIVWRDSDTLDIVASCNGQVVGTRLGEWSKTLSGLFS